MGRRFKVGKIEGDTEDMGFILRFLLGLAAIFLGYEGASKFLGVKSVVTKKDYGATPSKDTPKTSSPSKSILQPAVECNEEKKHPWKDLRGSGGTDDGTKTPLQGKWIVKERNTIIYSLSNVGKSILAGQMALDIAAGRKSEVIPMDDAPARQFVMYFDIEKDGGDFNGKYKSYLDSHPEIRQWIKTYGWTDDYEWVLEEIYDTVIEKHDTVVFIDNIAALLGDKNIEKFKTLATRLQIYLKTQKEITLTFVLIMHCKDDVPKYRQLEFKDDIKNDGNLGNAFAENVIGMGMTTYSENAEDDKEIVRIKACKNKSGVTPNPVIVARKVEEPYFHFERVMMCNEIDTVTRGARLPLLSPTSQPDSTSSQSAEPEVVVANESYRLTAEDYGRLSDAEKFVIYGIVKQELASGTTGVKIAERMQQRLAIKVSPTIVSTINKDKGDIPKRLAHALDKGVVDKVEKLYFADKQNDRE